MKPASLICILFFCTLTAFSQLQQIPAEKFTSQKGFSLKAIVQPMIYRQSALNETLVNEGLPAAGNFNLQLGLGTSYLFKTGTELALDVVAGGRDIPSPAYRLSATLLNYDFVVRQNLFAVNMAKFYVVAGAGGFEQYLKIERPAPQPAGFSQALAGPNIVSLMQFTDYMVFGLGLRALGNESTDKAITDYAAFEMGFRHQLGDTFWNTFYHEINDGPEARLRQFYLSFKYGFFLKGKLKPVRKR